MARLTDGVSHYPCPARRIQIRDTVLAPDFPYVPLTNPQVQHGANANCATAGCGYVAEWFTHIAATIMEIIRTRNRRRALKETIKERVEVVQSYGCNEPQSFSLELTPSPPPAVEQPLARRLKLYENE